MERGGRSDLAAGHSINPVVDHDNRDVDVPTRSVDEMVTPNSHTVSIAGKDHDFSSGVGKLQPAGKGNGPPVKHVEDIGLEIGRQPPGTANSPHESQVMKDAHLIDCPEEYVQDSAIPATRAKDQGEARFANIFISQRVHEISVKRIHRKRNLPSAFSAVKVFYLRAEKISDGVWTSPPNLGREMTSALPATTLSTSR